MNKNLVKIITFAVVLICGVLLGIIISQQTYIASKLSFLDKNILSSEEAGKTALNYINQDILKGKDVTASLTEEPVAKNGVYELKLKISDSEFISYLTKDGKLLFPEVIKLEKESTSSKETSQNQEGQSKVTCGDIKKSERPAIEAFVVSYCPFGTQMQRILTEIVKNIPELVENIKIEYIGKIQDGKISSMHGEEEAQENLTQICLREEESSKYFPYLSCFLKEGKQKECLTEVNVDMDKLNSCKTDKSRGLSYAQKDFDLQDKYKITGSPTLIINGQDLNTSEKPVEFNFGGRTAEAVKTLLCCGFKGENSFCQKDLTEEQAATGFSETYSVGQSDSGSCK